MGRKVPRPPFLDIHLDETGPVVRSAVVDDELDDDYSDDDCEEETVEDGDLTPLAVAAAATHEVYEALVDAGFTEWEGLRIIAWLISEQVVTE